MKVLPVHARTALARSLVEAGHHVQMVCLRHALTHTGLTGPFIDGKRSGFVDGIEVIEFDLPYSNHAGLLERAVVFLRYSWNSLNLHFVLTRIWCSPPHRSPPVSPVFSPVGSWAPRLSSRCATSA